MFEFSITDAAFSLSLDLIFINLDGFLRVSRCFSN